MEMPVFTIRGKNHRERGVDYGVQCKELIQGVLERYIRSKSDIQRISSFYPFLLTGTFR